MTPKGRQYAYYSFEFDEFIFLQLFTRHASPPGATVHDGRLLRPRRDGEPGQHQARPRVGPGPDILLAVG